MGPDAREDEPEKDCDLERDLERDLEVLDPRLQEQLSCSDDDASLRVS